jgi:hypothetical protein
LGEPPTLLVYIWSIRLYTVYMTLTKVSFNIAPETKEALEAIKGATGLNSTAQIRKGISLLKYVLDAQNAGKEFRVYEKDGGYRVFQIIL